jgi:hypothetical protein
MYQERADQVYYENVAGSEFRHLRKIFREDEAGQLTTRWDGGPRSLLWNANTLVYRLFAARLGCHLASCLGGDVIHVNGFG